MKPIIKGKEDVNLQRITELTELLLALAIEDFCFNFLDQK